MHNIGCVNIDTSHPETFASKMRELNLDMSYTAVYNDGFRTDEEVSAFMKKAGIEKRCGSLEEMAELVDIAFIHDCDWDKHIPHALPFIEKGKPVFIDKPIVGRLSDCHRLMELRNQGAVGIGSSSLRYAFDLIALKEDLAYEGESIQTVFATVGVDEFNYGVHIMEGVQGLLGPGAASVQHLGSSRNGPNPCEQYLVEWNNGVQVIFQIQTGQWQPFEFLVTTDMAIHHLKIYTARIYEALLKKIQAFLKNGEIPAPLEDLTETIKIYLAGKKSRKCAGAIIPLDSLSLSDEGFDGATFEKQYAIKTREK